RLQDQFPQALREAKVATSRPDSVETRLRRLDAQEALARRRRCARYRRCTCRDRERSDAASFHATAAQFGVGTILPPVAQAHRRQRCQATDLRGADANRVLNLQDLSSFAWRFRAY